MGHIESAIQHTLEESGLQHVESSLRAEFDAIQKAHDAIHEFMLIAPLCFPTDDTQEISWKNKSAFLIYHWEIFHHAHRSLIEALSTSYNVAFVLLRSTLELLLKGAFWECLSHRRFRDSSLILDTSSEGKKVKNWLRTLFEVSPNIEGELDQTSAGIFDKVDLEDRTFRLPVKALVQQLGQWGIFSPMSDADSTVYEKLYSSLSADVHVIPDRTDIGRRMVSEKSDIFEQQIDQALLREYATILHGIMDVAIVVELNIMQDLIKRFESVRLKLSERLTVMEQLELKYSLLRAREILK